MIDFNMFWTLVLANLVSGIIFWLIPIIMALVFKKKLKKLYNKINKFLK
jgi:uncharacterized membrane protein